MKRFLGLMFLTAACGLPNSSTDGDGGAATDGGVARDGGSPSDAGTSTDGGNNLGLSCSGASPSFATDVHPFLNGCGGEMCHGGLAQGAWTYGQLVNVHAVRDTCDPSLVLVTAGRLDQSYILNKLTGIDMCPGTVQMPIYGTLPPADLQTLVDWICQGAQNN